MKHLTLIVTFYSSKLKVIKRIEKKIINNTSKQMNNVRHKRL